MIQNCGQSKDPIKRGKSDKQFSLQGERSYKNVLPFIITLLSVNVKEQILMKTEDIFNANSYTSKAMPVTHDFFYAVNSWIFSTPSDEIQELIEKHKPISNKYNALYQSLNKEQQKILDDEYESFSTEVSLTGAESFAKGLKLGFRLAIELLG